MKVLPSGIAFTCAVLICTTSLCDGAPKVRHNLDAALTGDCSYDVLGKCDQGLALFVNEKVLPVSESDKTSRCNRQINSTTCFKGFINRCMTGLEKGLGLILMDSFQDEIETRCAPGSPEYKKYAQHIACYNKSPSVRACLRKSVGSIDWISSNVQLKDQIKNTCCLFPTLKDCVRTSLVPDCGEDASQYVESILDKYFNELLDVACKKHKKFNCANGVPIPTLADNGKDVPVINSLVKLAFVAPKYP